MDQATWDKTLEDCTKSNWVAQEFIEIPAEAFPEFKPDMVWKKKNVNINFFAYDGEYGGGFVRVADSSIINIHQGGGLLPIGFVG